jgi:hypothetical protein
LALKNPALPGKSSRTGNCTSLPPETGNPWMEVLPLCNQLSGCVKPDSFIFADSICGE